jgi:hexosaminidase
MSASLVFASVCAACVVMVFGTSRTRAAETIYPVIPRPAQLTPGTGQFTLGHDTLIVIQGNSRELHELVRYVIDRLGPATGFRLRLQDQSYDSPPKNAIVLTLDGPATLGDEGYTLVATSDGVRIAAHRIAGLFHGVQTLRQLLPPLIESPTRVKENDTWTIPAVTITDVPRFRWRGMLLDVGRHFRTVDEVKRYIDLLAYHKMNVLHWHLTEDQGWRIEIKKYPKLTEVGAWRDDGKGGRYGGFYTQDEVRDVVAYARMRHVTVVPEIELPGHCVAALAAYPELSCTGGPRGVATKWGIFEDVYCAGNDQTFAFLEDVLREVMRLFPGQFIHIGGDEVPKARWKACSKCQARMKRENLKDEHELQSWFIRRIDKFLTDNGRRLVGWDEILEGGLAPGATVQSWRGMEGAVAAATSGHDTIVSPTSHCYLDYGYDRTPVEKSYAFEPVPPQLTPDQASHVLGLEGNIWAERTPTLMDVDRQVWPRLCALSEVAWSDPKGRNFDEFKPRLEVHLQRLRLMGIQPGPTTSPATKPARQ